MYIRAKCKEDKIKNKKNMLKNQKQYNKLSVEITGTCLIPDVYLFLYVKFVDTLRAHVSLKC